MVLKALLCLTLTKFHDNRIGALGTEVKDLPLQKSIERNGSIHVELKCKYKVTRGQLLSVNNPAILQVKIGEACPRDEACRRCAKHHCPCQGQFTACSGCCKEEVPVDELHCRDVKSYYRLKNWCDLSLEPAGKATEEDDSDPDVGFQVNDHINNTFYSGTLVDDCNVGKDRVQSEVPTVVNFDCNPCNKGSPLLLKKCCDACVTFSKSSKLANVHGVRAFVACQGCQTTTINMPLGPPMNWKYAGLYEQQSRDAVDSEMDKWIEDNVCKLFSPSKPKCQRRLSSTEDWSSVCNTTTTTTTTTTTSSDVRDEASNSAVTSVGFTFWLALLISSA